MSFEDRVEDRDGYFTLWSGTHDPARVRVLDLYLYWRDGVGIAPPLEKMVNLEHLSVPLALFEPEALLALPRLRSLDLTMGNGEELPEPLFALDRLEYLDLTEAFLPELPDELAQLTGLRTLKLGYNGIVQLPRLPPNLVELKLESNELTSIPLGVLPDSLEILDLSSNPIRSLDGLPRSLRLLNVCFCRRVPLEALPPSLSVLLASSCELDTMPDLRALSALDELSFFNPDLPSDWHLLLPPQLGVLRAHLDRVPQLPQLRRLIAQGGRIERFAARDARVDAPRRAEYSESSRRSRVIRACPAS